MIFLIFYFAASNSQLQARCDSQHSSMNKPPSSSHSKIRQENSQLFSNLNKTAPQRQSLNKQSARRDAEEDDLDGDDDDTDGPALFDEYDDEEDFAKGARDDYGGEVDNDDEGGEAADDRSDGEEDEDGDGEAELEDVFAQAAENKEMDLVENLRRQADEADD